MAAAAAVVTCARQSFGTFPAPGHDAVRIGPLTLGDGYRSMAHVTAEDVRRDGGYKAGVVLRPGHHATIAIDRRSRGVAKLDYGDTGPVAAIRFVACSDGAGSTMAGHPVVFWPGRFVLRRSPACVRVSVRVDRRPVRHLRIPVGRRGCA